MPLLVGPPSSSTAVGPIAILLRRHSAAPLTPPARVGSPLGPLMLILRRRLAPRVALRRADIREAIAAFLLADPDLTAIVGSRVFDQFLPESETRAALVYMLVSQTRPRNLSGSDGTAIALFHFEAVTKDAAKAVAIDTAVNDLLDGLSNVALPVAGCLPIWVLDMIPAGDADDVADMGDATGRPLMPTTSQYSIHYRYQKKS